MTETRPTIREAVGTFADRDHFQKAVDALLAAGFERPDLSVLASHASLESAGREGKSWPDALTALVGEVKYEWPLVTAGIIALFAGPVGAAVAALVAAGIGGMAFKEALDEVSAIPDSEDFARALAAGSVILWVAAADSERETLAKGILTAHGAGNVHVFERRA